MLLSICSSPITVPAACFAVAWQLFSFKQEIVTKEYLEEYLDKKLNKALKPLYIMQALMILPIAKGALFASPPLYPPPARQS